MTEVGPSSLVHVRALIREAANTLDKELRVMEDKGIELQDKESMSVLVRVLSVSRTPEERMWLARQIERTAIEDGYLRREYRKHPKLVNPPRWRDSQ